MYLDTEQIEKLISDLDSDTKALKKELLKFCWFMRGGITYTEALNLCIDEREIIADIIKDNLEVTKESGLSFF